MKKHEIVQDKLNVLFMSPTDKISIVYREEIHTRLLEE